MEYALVGDEGISRVRWTRRELSVDTPLLYFTVIFQRKWTGSCGDLDWGR